MNRQQPTRISTQPRERATGQYAFEGDWGRKCVCGHELGVHTAEAPHECMNSDRKHIACDGDEWFDKTIEPTPCDCVRFRPTRKRAHTRPKQGD
jgi:hypothetical protein